MDQRVTPGTQDFTALYDELVEFNDYCAFFCDAVSCLLSQTMECEPDARTVMGLQRQCIDLKVRGRQLEALLVNAEKP